MSTLSPPRTALRAQVSDLIDRYTAVADASGPDRPVPATPGWTVRTVTAHLLTTIDRYAAGPAGGMPTVTNPTDLAALNDQLLRARDWPDLPRLLTELREHTCALLDQIDGYGDAQPSYLFNANQPVRADTALGILLGELAVHGHDVAAATGSPWPVSAAMVDLVLHGLEQILPGWVNPRHSTGHTAAYLLRLRGSSGQHAWSFTDGALDCHPDPTGPFDCHLWADPAALLLVMYRRRSPWRVAATGQILACGRRPWLALTLANRFHPP